MEEQSENGNEALISAATARFGDTVRLDDEEGVKKVLQESVLGLWEVVNNLTRLRPARNERFRVTIFGSARARPGTDPYTRVRQLACELAQMGCDIITGGGPGLMQAANEGAVMCGSAGSGASVGIRVNLSFEQETNPFAREVYMHRTFFSRLHHFVLISDAFVVVPGGIGTLLELTMIFNLLKVRNLPEVPLIVIGEQWRELIAWARAHMVTREMNFAEPYELAIPRCVNSPEEALTIIREYHSRWRREAKPEQTIAGK